MSGIAKRSITLSGHRTSVSLEPEFWQALQEASAADGRSLASLVGEIDTARGSRNLSSAIRVYVLARVRARPGS